MNGRLWVTARNGDGRAGATAEWSTETPTVPPITLLVLAVDDPAVAMVAATGVLAFGPQAGPAGPAGTASGGDTSIGGVAFADGPKTGCPLPDGLAGVEARAVHMERVGDMILVHAEPIV